MRVNYFSVLFFCVLSFSVYSQSNFRKATVLFTDESQKELMVNELSIFNRHEFKNDEIGKTDKLDITKVSKILFENGNEYVVKTVDIDLNRKDHQPSSKIYTDVELKLTKQLRVLKVLVKGSKSLLYTEFNDFYFFYVMQGEDIEYLVYNKYYKSGINQPVFQFEDKTFKRQLFKMLECDGFDKAKIQPLKYKVKDLKNLFIEYSKCDGTYVEVAKPKSENKFRMAVLGGVSYDAINVSSNRIISKVSGSSISPIFGVEGIYNIQSHDFFLRSSFFAINQVTSVAPRDRFGFQELFNNTKIESNYLNFSLGYRKYFTVSSNVSTYFSGALEYGVSLNGRVYFRRMDENNQVSEVVPVLFYDNPNMLSLGLGFGLTFSNKYGVELKYIVPNDLLHKVQSHTLSHSSFQLLGFYRFDF